MTRVVDSLVDIGNDMRLRSDDGGNGALLGQPWAFRAMATLDRDEDVLMVLRQAPSRTGGDLIQVAVTRRSMSNDRVSTVTMHLRTATLSESDVRQWLDGVIDSRLAARFGGRKNAETAIRAQLFKPITVPAVRRFISGSHGTLFFERVSIDTQHHWEHRTSAGILIGTFILPREWILQDAAATTFVAIRRTTGAADTLISASLQKQN